MLGVGVGIGEVEAPVGPVDADGGSSYDAPMRGFISVALALGLLATVSGSALALRGDPQKRMIRADQARARAMLLRRSDLGASFKPKPPNKGSGTYCPSDDESDLTLTGGADSPEWTHSQPVFWVSSGSRVYESVADARRSWKRLTRQATQRCLADSFHRNLSATISFHRRSFPRVAQQTFEYRLSDLVRVQGGEIGIYIDLVLLRESRAIAILGFGSSRHPPTRAYEERVAGVVGNRMQKAMQGA